MATMFGALNLLIGFYKDLIDLFSVPIGRALLLVVAILLGVGTFFYTLVEGWGIIDSFYFSVISLTTVGYGDFAPQTDVGKLFTTIYIFLGLSVIATFASSIAKTHARRIAKRHGVDVEDQAHDTANDKPEKR